MFSSLEAYRHPTKHRLYLVPRQYSVPPRPPTPLTPTTRNPHSFQHTCAILSTGWWAGARKACRARDGRVAVTIPGGVSTHGNSPRFRRIALWTSRRVSPPDLCPSNKKQKLVIEDARQPCGNTKLMLQVVCIPFAVIGSVRAASLLLF